MARSLAQLAALWLCASAQLKPVQYNVCRWCGGVAVRGARPGEERTQVGILWASASPPAFAT